MVNATPRPLYPREGDPVPIAYEAGWAPGLVWTGVENLAPTGIRSPDRAARSEPPYRLSYRGPQYIVILGFETSFNQSACFLIVSIQFTGIISSSSRHSPFLPGTSLQPAAIPFAQVSSIRLQYFPYHMRCSKHSCVL